MARLTLCWVEASYSLVQDGRRLAWGDVVAAHYMLGSVAALTHRYRIHGHQRLYFLMGFVPLDSEGCDSGARIALPESRASIVDGSFYVT